MAETSFNFKEAFDNLNKHQTLEEQVDDFLRHVIDIIRKQKIKRKDINEIQFSICLEQHLPPLRYGVYVTYTIKKEDRNYHQITATSNMSYPEASFFIQIIKDKLTKEGYECDWMFGSDRVKNSKECIKVIL